MNSVTGAPVEGARIIFASALTTIAGGAVSDSSGYYLLPLLSPGLYQIRVTADGYQSQEIENIELTVAARVDLDLRLRPLNDVWEAGQYNSVFLPGSKTIVTFYGPDVDSTKTGSFEAERGRSEALESTISEVIDQNDLNDLPLEGRDVYSLLVTQPGVTSDAGTARGLGLSINGTRPTSSNFMLDGVENNNYLTTGPLTIIAPEAIEEYRISTNNFSAEYGRTAGYVANAITKSGSDQFHGLVYFYLENDVLNANSFQQNLIGAARSPDKQIEPGYSVGGPVLKNRLFFSSAFEHFSNHSFQGPATFLLPSTNFLSFVSPSGSPSIYKLLTEFPPPAVTDGTSLFANYTVAPPVDIERDLGIERLDYTTPSGRDRIMARGIFVNMSEPDFIWSPYKNFITPLIEDTWAIGGSYIHSFSASLTNEFRLSRTDDDLHFNRPHPEIPTLLDIITVPNSDVSSVTLPGSEQFYSYKNHSKTTELLDNLIWSRDRHLITIGGGILFRNVSGYLTAGADGEYTFMGLGVAEDAPSSLTVTIERDSPAGEAIQPNYPREWAYNQYFLFAQDSFRLTPRLTLNYGLRYENYGSPRNVGQYKDTLLDLGSGTNMNQQLAGASLVPGSGSEQLFGTDNLDIAVRVGASYDLFGTGRTLLRGGFGTFYDRPFDNLWQDLRSNDYQLVSYTIPGTFNYLAPISSVLPGLAQAGPAYPSSFPNVTLVAPNLLNGRTSSYFAGIQHRITNDFVVEVNGLGTYGRNLVTTDIVNRAFTMPDGARPNPDLPDVNYRANQGFSNYNALTVVARYRWSRGYFQASYTWSHYIDNQSDPLTGDFFDLSFTNINSGSGGAQYAAFPQQYNPKSNIGNSDYDQPNNLVLFSYWNLPTPLQDTKFGALFRGWIVSGLAAFRSGLPYTVIDNASPVIPGDGTVINPRPDLINPNPVLSNPTPVPGGEQLLNPAAFATVTDAVGTLGRNSLIGPGIYNIDLSLGRSFGLRWLGDAGRLEFRADAYNILNHANLNNPDTFLGDTGPCSISTSCFGAAQFGRVGFPSGFPAVSPLNETPREIQLMLRVQF